MNDAVVLDSSPLGVLCKPNHHAQTVAIRVWVANLLAAGRLVIIPEIADSEVPRDFVRNRSLMALSFLNTYGQQLEYLPLSTDAMRMAADL